MELHVRAVGHAVLQERPVERNRELVQRRLIAEPAKHEKVFEHARAAAEALDDLLVPVAGLPHRVKTVLVAVHVAELGVGARQARALVPRLPELHHVVERHERLASLHALVVRGQALLERVRVCEHEVQGLGGVVVDGLLVLGLVAPVVVHEAHRRAHKRADGLLL